MDPKFAELKKNAKGLRVLYAEDNKGLQKQASNIFAKFFEDVIPAADGKEAIELFDTKSFDIVITDIKMPHVDGLELSRYVKDKEPRTKVIITSAFDEREFLYKAIDVGVDKYLKKPIALDTLIEALLDITAKISHERNQMLFNFYIKDVFQHQDNLLMLLDDGNEILIVNNKTLEFFDLSSLGEFQKLFSTFDTLLLPHNNFLYNHGAIDWLESIKKDHGKLFNVKIADISGQSRHFILKAYTIPDKKGFFILSFDDITELNLLAIYDKDAVKQEQEEANRKTIYNLLDIIKRNHSTLKIYNSYKGLSIANTAVMVGLNETMLTLQSTYLQLRAMMIDKSAILESELFPQAILCDVESVNYETQKAVLKNPHFIEESPSQREFVRVEPEQNHKITIFFNDVKILADTHIVNISVKGVKAIVSLLPPGFKLDDTVRIDIVLNSGTKPLIINTPAYVHKLVEKRREFEIVLLFEQENKNHAVLTEYISKRQMALIREFKGLKHS